MPAAQHKTYSDIIYATANGVAIITLSRPDKLNAWRSEMDHDLRGAMRVATEDPDVRVIILTGAGRGFCAGADMSRLQSIRSAAANRKSDAVVHAPPAEAWDPSTRIDFQKQYSWFPAVPKPIIAAINGVCAGLGLILALYADVRFASDAAKFTTAFSRRGLVAEHGVAWLLPRAVGFANAADLLFSARTFSANEAERIGLVSRVIAAESFQAEVMSYALMLAHDVSPRSLREMKRELWEARLQSLSDAVDSATRDMQASFGSEDFREGIAHFVEKRSAKFTGQ